MPTPTKKADTQALAADPTEPTYPSSLAEALLTFQSRMPRIAKDKTATVPTKSGGSYSYKYADLAGVQEVALPMLNDYGLTFVARPRRCEDGSYELVGVLTFAPTGEISEGSLPLFTRGTPQELGSAITYARRYLLTSMTGLVTEEDDDGQVDRNARDRVSEEQAEAMRRQAALKVARPAAFDRWIKAGNQPDRNAFMAEVESVFAQPFDDITVEQLDTFMNQPVGAAQ